MTDIITVGVDVSSEVAFEGIAFPTPFELHETVVGAIEFEEHRVTGADAVLADDFERDAVTARFKVFCNECVDWKLQRG